MRSTPETNEGDHGAAHGDPGEARPAAGAVRPVTARRAGFESLFDRERLPMVRLGFLMTGDEAVAEEVVQEAFTAVYLRWDRLDNPGGYLRRCVVNGATHHARRRAVERRKLAALTVDPVDLEARELLDALAGLRPAWRAVVVLRFYEGLTQDQIADVLRLRPGTVKSSLHRALAQLRKEIPR